MKKLISEPRSPRRPPKVKTQVDVPAEFKLRRYLKCGQMDEQAWAYQISRRVKILNDEAWSGDKSLMKLGYSSKTHEEVVENVSSLLRHPLDDNPSHDNRTTNSRIHEHSSVNSATLQDILYAESSIDPKLRTQMVKLRKSFSRMLKDPLPLRPIFECAEEPNDSLFGLVSVNLRLPSSDILKAFEDWLIRIQHYLPEQPRMNAPSLEKWTEMKLLECMDLLLWSLVHGVKLKPARLSLALFGEDHHAKHRLESLRATTIPLSNDLLQQTDRGSALLDRLNNIWADRARVEMTSHLQLTARKNSKKPSQSS